MYYFVIQNRILWGFFLSLFCFVLFFCNLYYFVSAPEKRNQAGEKGGDYLVILTTISTKMLFQHSSAFVSGPLHLQRQTMEYLCCSVCLIPILYASTKQPFHSDIHSWSGISSTRGTPPYFTFTKKIGVSENQDHMGFCVLF